MRSAERPADFRGAEHQPPEREASNEDKSGQGNHRVVHHGIGRRHTEMGRSGPSEQSRRQHTPEIEADQRQAENVLTRSDPRDCPRRACSVGDRPDSEQKASGHRPTGDGNHHGGGPEPSRQSEHRQAAGDPQPCVDDGQQPRPRASVDDVVEDDHRAGVAALNGYAHAEDQHERHHQGRGHHPEGYRGTVASDCPAPTASCGYSRHDLCGALHWVRDSLHVDGWSWTQCAARRAHQPAIGPQWDADAGPARLFGRRARRMEPSRPEQRVVVGD